MEKARASRERGKVRFLVHDLHEQLPFADGVFDRVVSGLVLEHLSNPDAFFAEARRVLKPGGRAVVSGMHPAMFLRNTRAHFHDPLTGETGRAGQRGAPDRRLRDGGGAGGVLSPGDRRAGPRRRLRRALLAGREVRRLADAQPHRVVDLLGRRPCRGLRAGAATAPPARSSSGRCRGCGHGSTAAARARRPGGRAAP